jgi:hypothetical protein
VQSQQGAVPRPAHLGQHPLLLGLRDIQYGRTGYRESSTVARWCCNSRTTKEILTVPISCILV